MAGLPWATCWETPSGGQFWYRFVRWRALPGRPAGKWAPEATFRIDLYAGGASLATWWEMAPRGFFRTDLYADGASLADLLGNAPGDHFSLHHALLHNTTARRTQHKCREPHTTPTIYEQTIDSTFTDPYLDNHSIGISYRYLRHDTTQHNTT